MRDWLSIAMRNDILIRGLRVGGLVGTTLVLINQGDVLLSGQLELSAVWKIPLTYLVPYCVSTYASVSTELASRN